MKKYIAPELEIAKFTAEDIVTTSLADTNTVLNYDGYSVNDYIFTNGQ